MMLERDKLRKEGKVKKKLEMKIDSLKFKEYTHRKIAFAQSKFDVKLMQQKNEGERKEKLNGEKKKYFDQLKDMATRREKEFHRIKTLDMMKSLASTTQQERQRMLQFIEKHKKLEFQKLQMDMAGEQQKQIIESKLSEGVLNARMKQADELQKKAQNVMIKHDLLRKRAMKKKEDKERERMYLNEIGILKHEEHSYNLQKQTKIDDFHRNKSLEKMRERDERVEEYRKQRIQQENEKKRAGNVVVKKKKNNKEFYDKIMNKHSSITLEDLQEMFPGDNEIIEKFVKFKEGREKGKSRSRYNGDTSFNNGYSSDNFHDERYRDASNSSFRNSDLRNNSFQY